MPLARALMLAIPVLLGAAAAARESKEKPKPPIPVPPTGKVPPTVPTTPPLPAPPEGSIIAALPEGWSVSREGMILDAVRAGLHEPPDWTLVWSHGEEGTDLEGWRLGVPVMNDALKIEGVRPIGSFNTGQAIADHLGLQVATPWMAALTYEQAPAQLTPTLLDPVTASKSGMIKASKLVDEKLAKVIAEKGLDPKPLVGNVSKWWVLTTRNLEPGVHPVSKVPRSEAGANHGLFTAPWQPIQNVGLFHNRDHADNTQGFRFMGPESILVSPDEREQITRTAMILTMDDFAPLLTGRKGRIRGKQVGEGALPWTRHPAILPPGLIV